MKEGTATIFTPARRRKEAGAWWQSMRLSTHLRIILPILAVALLLRGGFIFDLLYRGDVEHFAIWMNIVRSKGLFNFYNPMFRMGPWDRAYPPFSTIAFGAMGLLYGVPHLTYASLEDPFFQILLKMMPILCELVLIVAAYWWLRDKPKLRWLVPLAIAVYPGLIVTSAWWGQDEAPFTLFLCLSLFALNKDRPRLAWLMYAAAVLFKQPAAVLGPLLLVVTLRRYGWRTTLEGMGLCGLFIGLVLLPFALATSPNAALSPYLNASDAYPNMTNNAYNFWYTIATLAKGKLLVFEEKFLSDHRMMFGPISYKQAGFALLITFVLISMLATWRDAHRRREFVWGAALFMGFFILPTQVHERYVYPAAILAIFAAVQDRRLVWVAFALVWSLTYNVLSVAIPIRWETIATAATQSLSVPTAVLNTGLLVFMSSVAWYSRPLEELEASPGRAPQRPAITIPAGASD